MFKKFISICIFVVIMQTVVVMSAPSGPYTGLMWEAMQGADSYRISWRDNLGTLSDTNSIVITSPRTSALFTDMTGLVDPIGYFFAISVIFPSGYETGYSAEVQNVSPVPVEGVLLTW